MDNKIAELLRQKLNSERIAYFFGSYGLEQLPFFSEGRVTNLYSIHDNEKIMRTLAIVDFIQPIHPALTDVHREIMEGKSLALTLRQRGWMVNKVPIYFGIILLSSRLMEWMREKESNEGAIHIYQMRVSNEGQKDEIPYCVVIEIHSPQYLTSEKLRAIYLDQYDNFRIRTDDVVKLLDRVAKVIFNLKIPKEL